jgi:hypothetical protein
MVVRERRKRRAMLAVTLVGENAVDGILGCREGEMPKVSEDV